MILQSLGSNPVKAFSIFLPYFWHYIFLYSSKIFAIEPEKIGWRCGGSNPVPLACEASALPIELHPHLVSRITIWRLILLAAPHRNQSWVTCQAGSGRIEVRVKVQQVENSST